MPIGVVMRSTGSRYLVRGPDGAMHACVAKGSLRVKGWNSTNPLAVGDRVEFSPQLSDEEVGAITGLHDRANYIVRRSVNLSHHKHVIAANMDQAMLLATVARPRTSFGFMDRFLVTAEAYRIPAVVVLNKVDACNDEELEMLATYQEVYEEAGYRVLVVSALNGFGMKDVVQLLAGKVTLIAGHSGVGKSTLINAISPDLDLATMEVSGSSSKGQHTTTFAEMYALDLAQSGYEVKEAGPTFIIDTPGVKGFGLVDMSADEIVDQFPEMFKLKGHCRFNDCKHMQEPGCAVVKAVEEGGVAESRYNSYVDMVNGVDEESPYRLD